METFEDLNLTKPLRKAIEDLGFETPTPIQSGSFSLIRSGKNVVGISQTGTGKTLAFMLPLLQDLKFSTQVTPRILVLVPTRELVLQLVEQIKLFAKYTSLRIEGVFGGTNINTQSMAIIDGVDILVATPGRLYDLTINNILKLRDVRKLVIDEIDVMLDLGFRFQLTNIFDLLPDRRQNIMFSATMTDEIEDLIDDHFARPKKISIAVSGTPLDNISQVCYHVKNFYTKVNLLAYLLEDKEVFSKVLIFASSKKDADLLHQSLSQKFGLNMGVIHSNKSQNFRIRSIEDFDSGLTRLLVATDVMARGLDLNQITHVINFDTPKFPENYMHRIGRTGRAEKEGKSVLFYTDREEESKLAIEVLMNYEIPLKPMPEEVDISHQLTLSEREGGKRGKHPNRNSKLKASGGAFHEKSAKNSKTNQGGSYKRKIAAKYSKPKTRGAKKGNK